MGRKLSAAVLIIASAIQIACNEGEDATKGTGALKPAPVRTEDKQKVKVESKQKVKAKVKVEDKWDMANREVSRLSPQDFPHLPSVITQELQSRGYRIPQAHDDPDPHNVIRGEFKKKGQTDWAVLCSKDLVSSILIFWDGSPKDPSEIARMPDKIFLQGVDRDRIGYSRLIWPVEVEKDRILDYHAEFGGPEPPQIDHEGIEDVYSGKGSVVHYYHGGQWIELTGTD